MREGGVNWKFFLFVIGSLTMLRTCRRSNELENAWRKREAAI